MHHRMPHALRAARGDGGIGHQHAFEHHIVRARAAHAECVPVRHHAHTGALHRQCEMQHRGPGFGIVIHRAGHEQVRHRRTAGEDLAPVHAEAAIDARGLAAALQPVRATAAQQHHLLARHALEQPFHRRLLVAPAPCRGGHRVRVHGKGERGRSAVLAQLSQHAAQLLVRQAGTAQLLRHGGGKEPVRAQVVVVRADELPARVDLGGAGVEGAAQRRGKCEPVGLRTCAGIGGGNCFHGVVSGLSDPCPAAVVRPVARC
ncbi:hypothetical protein D9M72_276830 [compost metagenome]